MTSREHTVQAWKDANRRAKTAAGILLALTVCFVALGAVLWPHSNPPALSDRINSACPAGFRVEDWTAGDDYNPQPNGVIQVKCVDADWNVRTVAVQR